jgi:hypothetical protein
MKLIEILELQIDKMAKKINQTRMKLPARLVDSVERARAFSEGYQLAESFLRRGRDIPASCIPETCEDCGVKTDPVTNCYIWGIETAREDYTRRAAIRKAVPNNTGRESPIDCYEVMTRMRKTGFVPAFSPDDLIKNYEETRE